MTSFLANRSRYYSVLVTSLCIGKVFSNDVRTRMTDEKLTDTRDSWLDSLSRETSNQSLPKLSFDDFPKVTANAVPRNIFDQIPTLSIYDRSLFSERIDSQPEIATIKESYERRIDDLRVAAEDEGFSVASESETDFWELIDSLSPRLKATLVLSDGGNLIATWEDNKENYFEIKFLGDNNVEYMVFKESWRNFGTLANNNSDGTTEHSGEGSSTIQGIKSVVQKFGQENLLGIVDSNLKHLFFKEFRHNFGTLANYNIDGTTEHSGEGPSAIQDIESILQQFGQENLLGI